MAFAFVDCGVFQQAGEAGESELVVVPKVDTGFEPTSDWLPGTQSYPKGQKR